MDFATIIGITVGLAIIAYSVAIGGNFAAFIDIPSIFIVFGGALAATIVRFPLKGILTAFSVGAKHAFTHKTTDPRDLIKQLAEMGDIVRRSGALGLENFETDEPNLKKGAQYIADGYDENFIRSTMERDIDQYINMLASGSRIFKSVGDAAPAFGMVGTLVGLVQMLGSMEDASKIGPAMSVVLLTTLYGAVVANLICLPIADKLEAKGETEAINQSLILDGILAIREGKSPAVIREALSAYLPHKMREIPDVKEAA